MLNLPLQPMSKSFEIKGGLVIVALFALTGIVGTLFIVLGPQATERAPGVVHVGVRYLNERSLAFNQYGKKGPGATLQLIAQEGTVVDEHDGLSIGRNLVPLSGVPEGDYTAQLSAPGYETFQIPITVTGRMINPKIGANLPEGTHADYNMLGVFFRPLE